MSTTAAGCSEVAIEAESFAEEAEGVQALHHLRHLPVHQPQVLERYIEGEQAGVERPSTGVGEAVAAQRGKMDTV